MTQHLAILFCIHFLLGVHALASVSHRLISKNRNAVPERNDNEYETDDQDEFEMLGIQLTENISQNNGTHENNATSTEIEISPEDRSEVFRTEKSFGRAANICAGILLLVMQILVTSALYVFMGWNMY